MVSSVNQNHSGILGLVKVESGTSKGVIGAFSSIQVTATEGAQPPLQAEEPLGGPCPRTLAVSPPNRPPPAPLPASGISPSSHPEDLRDQSSTTKRPWQVRDRCSVTASPLSFPCRCLPPTGGPESKVIAIVILYLEHQTQAGSPLLGQCMRGECLHGENVGNT